MPVNTYCQEYRDKQNSWEMIDTILQGESAIKDAGELYLPKLTAQSSDQYTSYKERGTFYNGFKKAIKGMSGAVIRKPPIINIPSYLEDYRDNMTLSGLSLTSVILNVLDALLSYGRYGILNDMMNDRPYMALYSPLDIINWQTARVDGEEKIILLCLKEIGDEIDIDDEYVVNKVERVRALSLDENGDYLVQLFEKSNIETTKGDEWVQINVVGKEKDFYPQIRGKKMDYIPFVFFGAASNIIEPNDLPLLDLANLNIKHWQLIVDYYHGLHWCAIPTPYAAGFPLDTKLYVGGEKAWVSENQHAKAGFLEFSGSGMEAVRNAIKDVESMMARIGARLLEEERKGVEAAETIKIRSTGDTATLSSIVTNIEGGIKACLTFMSRWLGMEPKSTEIQIDLNRDFISQRLSPQDLTALLQAYQAGSISQDTFLHNLQMGEILPKDRTIEEEKEMIELDNPEEVEFDNKIIEDDNFNNSTLATEELT